MEAAGLLRAPGGDARRHGGPAGAAGRGGRRRPPLLAAGYREPEFPEVDGAGGLNFAGWAEKLAGRATITVGSVGLSGDFMASFGGEGSPRDGLERLVERMERDEFDLVAVGRAILADPRWVAKVRSGDAAGVRDFSASAMAEPV